MNEAHPRKYTKEEGYIEWPICSTNFGQFSNRNKNRVTAMSEYGAGIVLYFQFMKYMICLFVLLSILSIPSILLFASGNLTAPMNVKDAIVVTSLGNIGQIEPACSREQTQTINNKEERFINLRCKSGKLGELMRFGQMPVKEALGCQNIGYDGNSCVVGLEASLCEYNYFPS